MRSQAQRSYRAPNIAAFRPLMTQSPERTLGAIVAEAERRADGIAIAVFTSMQQERDILSIKLRSASGIHTVNVDVLTHAISIEPSLSSISSADWSKTP